MPTVEKTVGGRVNVRDIGEFEAGDIVQVSEADAAYLVEERGDFVIVDDGEDDGEDESTEDESAGDEPADEEVHEEDASADDGGGADGDLPDDEPEPEHLIEDGVCPWCDDYEGDNVGMHAASAHPDEWDAHTED